MQNLRLRFLLINLLTLSYLSFLSYANDDLQKISVQLEWKHQFEFAGFYAAVEQGYYKDIGLEVELKEYQDGINVSDEVLNGKSTFGISSSSLIIEKLNHKPIVLLASYFKHNALALAVKPDIKSPSDLQGRNIMALDWEIEHTSLGAMLKDNYIGKNDFNFIKHDYSINKFVNGEVDAISIFTTSQPYELNELGIKYNILNPAQFGLYSYDVELFTSKNIVIKNKEMVKDFINATNKGWKYAFENKQKIIELIYNKYSKRKSKEALMYEAIQTQKIFKTNIFKIGSIVPELVKLNTDMYQKLGLIKENYNISELFNEYLFDYKNNSQSNMILDNTPLNNVKNENTIKLSKEQIDYLKKEKEIKMCVDPDWMPFEKIDRNQHIGIAADYINIISEKIQTPIKLIETKSWEESINYAKERKCDIFSLASSTKQRQQYMNFSKPYLELPLVIATTNDKDFIGSLTELNEKTISLVKGYAITETIQKEYPKIKIVLVDSIKDGLKKVEKGDVYAYIDNLMTISYSIKNDFTGNLKISGRLENDLKLSIATRNDKPILNDIFNKSIDSISQIEKQEILNKWVNISYSEKIDYKLAIQILIISILIIAGTLYWNRRLSALNIELKKAKKDAEAATKAKSNFLATMSHEIKTPMNSIMGMTYLVNQTTLNEKQKSYINKIQDATTSLITIVNDILDFSKIEAGNIKLDEIEFNLNDILINIKNSIQKEANEKNIQFNIICQDNVPKHIFADSSKISQVLSNLLSNGVKFTQKGKVELHITYTKENKFRFTIIDTGIGLSQNEINQLFKPFTQIDSSTTRRYGGTGLGLSISKELVKLMGGEISVISQKSVGSQFIFELDLKVLNKNIIHNISSLFIKEIESKKQLKNIKHITKEKRDILFEELNEVILKRRPILCEPILEKIKKYKLNSEDEIMFKDIEKLIQSYDFTKASEILNGK